MGEQGGAEQRGLNWFCVADDVVEAGEVIELLEAVVA
jgi:hypothetical protein